MKVFEKQFKKEFTGIAGVSFGQTWQELTVTSLKI
jgi:hypothetical protein